MATKTVSIHTHARKKDAANVLCTAAILLILAGAPSNLPAQLFPSGSPVTGDSSKTNALSVNQGVLARNLIGSRVESTRGDDLGFVSDILIDPGSGRLDYVVIVSGGFIKFGRKFKPIPPNLLGTATAMRGVVEANIDSEVWKTAPTFAKAAPAALGDDATGRQIYAYYHQKWPGSFVRSDDKSAAKLRHHSANPDKLESASHFFGKPLLDRSGKSVARIIDILLDPGRPQITFAVFRLGTDSSATGAMSPLRPQFAVPVNDLTETSAVERRYTLAAGTTDFQQAQPLNAQAWAKSSSPTSPLIYKPRSDEGPSVPTPAASTIGH